MTRFILQTKVWGFLAYSMLTMKKYDGFVLNVEEQSAYIEDIAIRMELLYTTQNLTGNLGFKSLPLQLKNILREKVL